MYNVTFARIYRDAEDNWKESASFSRDDLLVVSKLADMSHTWPGLRPGPSCALVLPARRPSTALSASKMAGVASSSATAH
ncbi:MAG: hypothetical protein ABIP94_17975 [Planctomycetota bacterium]